MKFKVAKTKYRRIPAILQFHSAIRQRDKYFLIISLISEIIDHFSTAAWADESFVAHKKFIFILHAYFDTYGKKQQHSN